MSFHKRFLPIVFPPEGMISLLQGWRIFTIGVLNHGPVLELGPWVGCSTTFLAFAQKVRRSHHKLYSLDIHFSSREHFEEYFNENLDDTPAWRKERYMRHLIKEEGSLTSLRENLIERALIDYVDIRKGDFVETDFMEDRFSTIFCDICHDCEEIEKNMPKIKKLLNDDYVLICDDIRNLEMFNSVKRLIDPELAYFDKHMLFCGSGMRARRILGKTSIGSMSPYKKFGESGSEGH